MITECFPVRDVIETNSYFYIDEKTNHCFIVDPGAEADRLIQIIGEKNYIPEKILITHGHFDHIGAVEKLHDHFGIPYLIHAAGENYLKNIYHNLSGYYGLNIILNDAEYLRDSDIISLSTDPEAKLKLIHTPGHTADSSIYYDEKNKIAFVGDTIFKNSVGRTDLPGGDQYQLSDSILNKIFRLPDETILYSGHTEKTDVLTEKSRYF